MRNLNHLFCFFLLLLLLPLIAKADDCAAETVSDPHHHAQALKYKIVAIISILIAGAMGVGIPILGKIIPALSPEKNIFFLIKSFAAGIILATGCVHVLSDSYESLTSPCINEKPWGEFPFAGFTLMIAAIGTLMVEGIATSYYSKTHSIETELKCGDEEKKNVQVHTHTTHGHAHGSATSEDHSGSLSELIRHKIISEVLELGIVVHSVIIGLSLGASQDPSTIKPLVVALTFHQFFEGMGLGGCISQAKFKTIKIVMMMLFFSLTTPVGIGIGMGITNAYNENSPKALIVGGILNAVSAGILIYMSLVDIIAVDLKNPKVQSSGWLQFGVYVSLWLGAGSMSLLAIWA